MPLGRLVTLNTTECLWIYILRILIDGPTHAYAIRPEIRQRYGFMPGTMTAYKVLYLLRRRGLVRKEQSGRRQVYRITPAGRAQLRQARDFYRSRVELLKGI